MKKRGKMNNFLNLLYLKLFKINDTPQKVALGFGLGVAAGILPGTGPLAALFLSLIFRVNRASSLIGCLLTNSWLSFVTFILAIKLGSSILGIQWQQVIKDWEYFLKKFHWLRLFESSILKIALPALIGYFVISICLGVLAYLGAWGAIIQLKNKRKKAL